jgi:hypothetical protein
MSESMSELMSEFNVSIRCRDEYYLPWDPRLWSHSPLPSIITIITIIATFQLLLDPAIGVWFIAPSCVALGWIAITTLPATGFQITLPTAAAGVFATLGAFRV